ncbi:hypothetical protein O6P43_005218 [Quillaja saponaria]|uniref:Uncharacterized protein n=1 Tax=Quillaja saponaria TaxID=32244 RepID=A0AAD7Q668_QUISA|nr:hypothetical protein O6P43_005218 [Quillaja saponaria]
MGKLKAKSDYENLQKCSSLREPGKVGVSRPSQDDFRPSWKSLYLQIRRPRKENIRKESMESHPCAAHSD